MTYNWVENKKVKKINYFFGKYWLNGVKLYNKLCNFMIIFMVLNIAFLGVRMLYVWKYLWEWRANGSNKILKEENLNGFLQHIANLTE